MSRKSKIALGFATFSTVLVLLFMLVVMVFIGVICALFPIEPIPEAAFYGVVAFFLPVALWIIAMVAAFFICWREVNRNGVLDRAQKFWWKFSLFMAPVYALPAYWYFHIWREQQSGSSERP